MTEIEQRIGNLIAEICKPYSDNNGMDEPDREEWLAIENIDECAHAIMLEIQPLLKQPICNECKYYKNCIKNGRKCDCICVDFKKMELVKAFEVKELKDLVETWETNISARIDEYDINKLVNSILSAQEWNK